MAETARTALFLPFAGEFGVYLLWYVRAVHLYPADRKVVCCRPGDECLFPTAVGFFHNWSFDVRDQEAIGALPLPGAVADDIARRAAAQLGPLDVVNLYDLTGHPQERLGWLPRFKTHAPTRRDVLSAAVPIVVGEANVPAADIVVTARARQHHTFRNYAHWQLIVDHLKARGLRVGLIGAPTQSIPLVGIDVRSWEHGGVAACVQMMRNAAFMVTTDTGPAHLNVLIGGTPMLAIMHETWRGEEDALVSNPSIPTVLLPRTAWQDVSIVLRAIDSWILHPPQPLGTAQGAGGVDAHRGARQ